MPLDATHFYVKGPVNSADLRQFYDILTGAMNDQPVTFVNTLSVGGNQSVTTVPFRIFGAPGQNTNLIDLYPDRTSAQPTFGFSAVGQFAWGPGATSPQDTFLSRIATQHGHASDSSGLFITPVLEVAGYIWADGDIVVDRNSAGASTSVSPGLRFGDPASSGEAITSQRGSGGSGNRNGLDFWTGGAVHMQILQNGTVGIPGTVNISGNLAVAADIYSHYLHTSDGSNGVILSDMGTLYLRSQSTAVIADGAGGMQLGGSLLFQNNGYWLRGIPGVPALETAGSFQVDGGFVYFESSRQVYIGYRSDLSALYIPYGNGIYVGTATSVSQFQGKVIFAGAPNTPGARLAFPQEPTPKICYYDAGGGQFFGTGINSAELYICVPTNNMFVLRNGSSGGGIYASWATTGIMALTGTSVANQLTFDPNSPNITFVTPNDPQGQGQLYRVIQPSTRPASQVGGGELHIGLRLYVDGDITAGTYVHGISFMTTSDPNLKSNATVVTDLDCMSIVRNPAMPVYRYQIEPPISGGISPTPTDMGFMAPDVYTVAPEFAGLATDGTPVSVVYGQMVTVLWGALRSMDARLQAKGI